MLLNLTNEDLMKMRAVKSILEKEFKYHYTIDELAQKVGTNSFKLKVAFKQVYKVSTFEYLTAIRMEKAKEMLEFSDFAIKRIAMEIGYPMSGNFIRRFKLITGISPNEWRKHKAMSLGVSRAACMQMVPQNILPN